MVSKVRPWTIVLSEYLDLPFLMRKAGVPVVSVRSAREALECLRFCCPSRVVIDMECHRSHQVLIYVQDRYPGVPVEAGDQVVSRLLAS